MSKAKTAPVEAATEVAILPPSNIAVLTDAEKFEAFYERVRAEVSSHVPDLTTEQGRRAIASVAFKVTKTKTAIVEAANALTEEWRANTQKVVKSRQDIAARLDALRDEVRKPLTDWEKAEEERRTACVSKIGEWKLAAMDIFGTSQEITRRLMLVEQSIVDPAVFQDLTPIADVARETAIASLSAAVVRLEKAEADARELTRLREAEAKRLREEEERAKLREEEEAAERRRRQEEQAAAEAEQRRQEEAAEAERRREEERAERDRQEADRIAKAEQEAVEAAEKRAREVEAEMERAHQAELATVRKKAEEANAERERLAMAEANRLEVARLEQVAQDRRDKDRKHRAEVMKAAKDAMMTLGCSEEIAKKIVLAIRADEIPNVTLRF